jgi:hypothetical protein
MAKATKAAAKKAAKKAVKKFKRKASPSLMKPMTPSATLAVVVRSKPIPVGQITKNLWAYIKKNGLQDKTNKCLVCNGQVARPARPGGALGLAVALRPENAHPNSTRPCRQHTGVRHRNCPRRHPLDLRGTWLRSDGPRRLAGRTLRP